MAEEHPSITQLIAWMRQYPDSMGEPETKNNSAKLLRYSGGFYETNKHTLNDMIDDFEKIMINANVFEEKPTPLQRVGMQLLLDMIGYDPKRYVDDN